MCMEKIRLPNIFCLYFVSGHLFLFGAVKFHSDVFVFADNIKE